MKSLLLYWNTIKYLKPVQIYGRVYSIILKRIIPFLRIPRIKTSPFPIPTNFSNSKFIFHDPWNSRERILLGQFTFLNETKNLGVPINWDYESDLLWKFNLHYFNYLHLLNEAEKSNLIDQWIKSNPYCNGIGWHPYTISLRIVSWCKNGISQPNHVDSLNQQLFYLYNSLEFYHPGNHYLENARALIFGGLYLSQYNHSKKWVKKGREIISKEIGKQVLPDGGYFELSIMYHSIMLELFLSIYEVYKIEDEFKELLQKTINRMIPFLSSFTNPDGRITLFNDSSEEIAPSTKLLLENAQYQGIIPADEVSLTKTKYFKDSGYLSINENEAYITIDLAEIGPWNIPAHAHADIFHYNVTYKGNQFITDSGVYEYKSGDMRNYFRSTAAHNTMQLENCDQAECWGSFRVARRFNVENIFVNLDEEVIEASGTFNGYKKLLKKDVSHSRYFCFDKAKRKLSVKDVVSGVPGVFMQSFVHIHPEVNVELVGTQVFLERNGATIEINGSKNFTVEEGLYSPAFGVKISNKVLVLKSNSPDTVALSFSFN